MVDVNNAMIRTYGKRIQFNHKYWSPMVPQRLNGGIYKGMTLHTTTIRLREKNWWIENTGDKNCNTIKTQKELHDEKEEIERLKRIDKINKSKRLQPFVYEKNIRIRLNYGIYKGLRLLGDLSVKDQKNNIGTSIEKDESQMINVQDIILNKPLRPKYTIELQARNNSTRIDTFLRRSETHTHVIDVSSEEDEYLTIFTDDDEEPSNESINILHHPNALPWRRLLILRLFKPIEYVKFDGNINMSIHGKQIINARMDLPMRLSRPKRSWWEQFVRQLNIYVERKKVIYKNDWLSSKNEKTNLNFYKYSNKYDDNGISEHHTYDHPNENKYDQQVVVGGGKEKEEQLKKTTLNYLVLKDTIIRKKRFPSIMLNGGIYKKKVLINNYVDGVHVWRRTRKEKEPGGNITQSKTYQISKQVRRPRIPINNGMYKNINMFGEWVRILFFSSFFQFWKVELTCF
jgi:hypothetical protein